jgi:hypothetical protein
MTAVWSPDELQRIGTAEELHIATTRADGTLRREVPIWVVVANGQVYDTGDDGAKLRASVDRGP